MTAAGLAPPPGPASGQPAPRVAAPARRWRGLGGDGARVTFVSPAGLRGRWPLPAAAVSLRRCSTQTTLEGINKPVIDRIIRVDHAGEYGANRIYAGQMAVLGRSGVGPVIQVRGPQMMAVVLASWRVVRRGGAVRW